ncbi:MAG: electron transfer flavoprotein subunit alpha/FixB family protein [Bacteroidales bacterium]|nr:electron transfer flavoprotein subunit alpha/FixB family protein [Bacteroidales bacterium]MCF8345292.1 electron transfer flavoprotein subunit alpha/FixB family protein [Bacteroidales bacterium]MCF8352323.1 electron transfer flavoprotein subunit alpha/FixB family protein [Bacteroidales bacterium]MCF8377397.1 electron transfer flavoprotein subunit alpha/FixB family protein [Bacteroidales bacterium]MCF8401324.1 electron transfer flavoprotein subunit alpha/FixB family protein [Bacteroidales bact
MSVLAYTENWDGKFKKLSYELVSYAKAIAENLNTETVVASIGAVEEEELKKLGNYGADKVVAAKDEKLKNLANQPYAKTLAQIAEKENATVLVFAHNFTGKAVAPRVSVKLKAGLAAGVTEPPSSYDPFIIKRKVFTNKAFANVKINSDKKILTLFQNSFEIKETENKASIEEFTPELTDADFRTEVKEVNKVTGKILLTDAEIVVSGGRGMKGPEKWENLEKLAEVLGAATACSRPVSDEGWRPHEEHVGQTGKIVAPNLYIALGISGAIQHLGGVSSSKTIVAINTDKDAPIFESADYGIVGDVHKVLPQLIEAIKEVKAEG